MIGCQFHAAKGVILLGLLLMSPAATAQRAPTHQLKAQPGASHTFGLYHRNLWQGAVEYSVDGKYVVRPHELVVTIEGGPVVAGRATVLHSLRMGVCGCGGNIFRLISPCMRLV